MSRQRIFYGLTVGVMCASVMSSPVFAVPGENPSPTPSPTISSPRITPTQAPQTTTAPIVRQSPVPEQTQRTSTTETTEQAPQSNLADTYSLTYQNTEIIQGKNIDILPREKEFPQGTQFVLGDTSSMSGWNVIIDKNTGKISVAVNNSVSPESSATLNVRAVYLDGTYDDASVKIAVKADASKKVATPKPTQNTPTANETPYDIGPTFVKADRPPPVKQKTPTPKKSTYTPHPVEKKVDHHYGLIALVSLATMLLFIGVAFFVRHIVLTVRESRNEYQGRGEQALDDSKLGSDSNEFL